MDQQKIGSFLAETRKQKGLTQKLLAEQLGISDKTISKWENGKGMPDISYMEQVCKALEISVNELLSGERLSELEYSRKAETNMMDLMKENEKTKKTNTVGTIVGLGLVIGGVCLMFVVCQQGMVLLQAMLDVMTALFLVMFTTGGVLLSGKRTKREILVVIQKIIFPCGFFLVIIDSMILLRTLEDISVLGPNLAVGLVALLYALIGYVVAVILEQRIGPEN